MSPKVSVIIPVYNTEKYVEECLRSIINQTLKEIEIIVINDGSTDGSLAIIEAVARTDNRISVFSQENKGQSVTRNRGLEKATGQFVYFMDSDDLLVEEALQVCYDRAVADQLDFVFFNASVLHETSGKRLSFDYKRSHIEDNRSFGGRDILDYLVHKNSYRASVCLHLISMQFIKQHNLSFLPGIIHEDELFSALAYFQAKRVGYINEFFFKRRVRRDSIMTSSFSMRNVNGYFTVLSSIREFCKGQEAGMGQVADRLTRYIINPVCYSASSLRILDRLKVLILIGKNNYLHFIKSKNLLVLLFPSLIKIKGFFKS